MSAGGDIPSGIERNMLYCRRWLNLRGGAEADVREAPEEVKNPPEMDGLRWGVSQSRA